jgi:non-ribosomal peptide synthetase component F
MIGGAYCPLSSKDPPQRLQALVNQTESLLVMVDATTYALFEVDVVTLDVDAAISIDATSININLHQLSTIPVTPENIAFVIFTSGSTGIPKAVCMIPVFLFIYANTFC